MDQNKSVLIIFLSLILSCFFLSGDVFAYKKSDLNKFENTRKCIKCDLTDLNLSRVNLSRVNLSGSNLSGSDLSESDLSGSNLSGVNLSGVNLNGSNLKDVNLTYANLSEIIIDEKAFSTLDISEFTFVNKSTLAEEAKKKKKQELRKKKKKQELRKKKKQELRKKKKKQELRKKKKQELRKKKEKELRKKKEKELRKKKEDGYKDIKFNMDGETTEISFAITGVWLLETSTIKNSKDKKSPECSYMEKFIEKQSKDGNKKYEEKLGNYFELMSIVHVGKIVDIKKGGEVDFYGIHPMSNDEKNPKKLNNGKWVKKGNKVQISPKDYTKNLKFGTFIANVKGKKAKMKIDDNKIFMDQFKLLTNNNTIKKCLGEDITLFYSKTDKPIEKFVK